jgi:DNA helicase-2/ATP-dependent DNA helicase PcrA
VRVGDPNQAIYETFTTASPKHLREFIKNPVVIREELPYSGRSTKSIIDLANYLVDWTQNYHPVQDARDALQTPPSIQPTPKGDPQPNPPDDPSQIYLVTKGFKPDQEIESVVTSLANWLPSNTDRTVAVLVPRNSRADRMIDALEIRGIPYNDSLLKISSRTRSSAEKINLVLSYLADPLSSQKLADVYRISGNNETNKVDFQYIRDKTANVILKNSRVEDYLWPKLEKNLLDEMEEENRDQHIIQELIRFRKLITRWQKSIILPIDQIVLTISQDLFSDTGDLAIAQKIAVLLKQASANHPDWRMSDFVQEMDLIIHNQRRLLGFSEDDLGFDPDKHKGVVVVTTMHSAKGLEWDRVYLLSVNNYDFPGDLHEDQFISEKWFIRDNLNLQTESFAQLESLLTIDEFIWYEENNATLNSRLDYIRERLRLLYVGITRAKRELIITWNVGRKGNLKPAISLVCLQDFWLDQDHDLVS